MSREEIQKLLGGYATGTLTPQEEQALFAAALEDQELFDALAQEQSLRDLLRDPAAKAHLLAALDQRPERWFERLGWWKPAAAALAMAGLAAVVFVGVKQARGPQPAIVAQMERIPAVPRPQSAEPAAPVAPPAIATNPAPTVKDAPARTDGYRVKQAANAVAPERESSQKPAEASAETAEKKTLAKAAADAAPAAPLPTPAPAPTIPAPVDAVAGFRDNAAGAALGTVTGSAALQRAEVQTAPGGNDARSMFYGTDARQSLSSGLGGMRGTQALQEPLQQQQRGGQQAQSPPAPRQQQGQQGQQGPGAAAPATRARAAMPGPYVGVRYRILRKAAGGEFTEADAATLQAGDAVRLELMANDGGSLSVSLAGKMLFSRQVERLATYTTDVPVQPDAQLVVRFAPAAMRITGTAAFEQRKEEAVTPVVKPVASEHATYVMQPAGTSDLRFTIGLKVR